MTRLLLLSGSQRRESYNRRLLQHVAQGLQWQCFIDTLEPEEVHLPIFDQDRESDPDLLGPLIRLHQRFMKADGLVIATPEYNGQTSAYLKNLVDWVSRLPHICSLYRNPFMDRPVLLCSATTGRSGGRLAAHQVRALMSYVGGLVLGDEIALAQADQCWSPDGFRMDEALECRLQSACDRLAGLATVFSQQRQVSVTQPSPLVEIDLASPTQRQASAWPIC